MDGRVPMSCNGLLVAGCEAHRANKRILKQGSELPELGGLEPTNRGGQLVTPSHQARPCFVANNCHEIKLFYARSCATATECRKAQLAGVESKHGVGVPIPDLGTARVVGTIDRKEFGLAKVCNVIGDENNGDDIDDDDSDDDLTAKGLCTGEYGP